MKMRVPFVAVALGFLPAALPSVASAETPVPAAPTAAPGAAAPAPAAKEAPPAPPATAKPAGAARSSASFDAPAEEPKPTPAAPAAPAAPSTATVPGAQFPAVEPEPAPSQPVAVAVAPSAPPAAASGLPAPAAPPRGRDVELEPSAAHMHKVLALAVGGLGLVAIGVGTYEWLQAKSGHRDALDRCARVVGDCSSDPTAASLQENATDAVQLGNVAAIVGGAFLAGGVVLWLTAPSEAGATTGFTPAVGPHLVGLSATRTW